MKIAIVGTQGLPNQYGGFETLADYLVKNLSSRHDITVYCSAKNIGHGADEYCGAKLKYVNVADHGASGIIYDSICLLDAQKRNFDVILILGTLQYPALPFLKKKTINKVVSNFGGLDWLRNKWGKIAQKVIYYTVKMSVKYSKEVISDNKKIQDYVKQDFGKDSHLIAYGGDQSQHLPITPEMVKKYPFLNSKYAFEVARIQPDNNIEMLMKAFMMADSIPFVLVGNWNKSDYGIEIKKKYQNEKNLVLLDAIYDKNILDVLRSNCYFYVHGHSAGGTNPGLCEAMNLGLPIMAFSNGYNQNTTYNMAVYFEDENQLKELILSVKEEELERIGKDMESLAKQHYRWEYIASEYEKVCYKIIGK